MLSAIKHFIKKGLRQAEIEEFLQKELSRAGFGGVEIAKTPLGERLTVYAARPGIVIGRRGKNVRQLTEELTYRFDLENPQVEVKEVDNPELNAMVMASSLVSAIERGVHRRRAAYSVLRRVINAGAKGCEIVISGKLTSRRSRHEAYRMGLVAKSGNLASHYVDQANATAIMKLGTIGVTVNIMQADVVLPDEIEIYNVDFEEEVEEVVEEEVVEEEEEEVEEEVTPKEKEKEEKKEKPKAKEPEAEETDLDQEVKELSELIEETETDELEKIDSKAVEKARRERELKAKAEAKVPKKVPPSRKKIDKKKALKKTKGKKEEVKAEEIKKELKEKELEKEKEAKKEKPKKKEEEKPEKKEKPKKKEEVEEIEVSYKNRTYTFDSDITADELSSKRGVPLKVKEKLAKKLDLDYERN
ncbi:MAG: 30S ribosomal protein S3 [Candidatus Heimdallarchaeota archaeon]|nr:30S ribosomal protein S3 [Candidatus Heimdallarchaeota archaeon]